MLKKKKLIAHSTCIRAWQFRFVIMQNELFCLLNTNKSITRQSVDWILHVFIIIQPGKHPRQRPFYCYCRDVGLRIIYPINAGWQL